MAGEENEADKQLSTRLPPLQIGRSLEGLRRRGDDRVSHHRILRRLDRATLREALDRSGYGGRGGRVRRDCD